MHAIKIEDLNKPESFWNDVSKTLKDFLIEDIGYYIKDWINPIECRRRDGFIPYSSNKGGFSAFHYGNQLDFYFQPSGFDSFDSTCESTYNYVVECALEEHKISLEDYEKGILENNKEMLSIREDIEMNFGEYESCMFETMLKIENDNTLFVSFMLKANDAPYFRSYDDCIDFEVKFNTINQLKKELNKIINDDRVQDFIKLIE